MGLPFEKMAEEIFQAAIREARCGELLEALFEGGTATVDRITGRLVIMSNQQVMDLGNA